MTNQRGRDVAKMGKKTRLGPLETFKGKKGRKKQLNFYNQIFGLFPSGRLLIARTGTKRVKREKKKKGQKT